MWPSSEYIVHTRSECGGCGHPVMLCCAGGTPVSSSNLCFNWEIGTDGEESEVGGGGGGGERDTWAIVVVVGSCKLIRLLS